MEPETKRRRSRVWIALSAVAVLVVAFASDVWVRVGPELLRKPIRDPHFQLTPAIELASLPTAKRFDFPIGTGDGAFAYNAQPFTENRHLGDDLNGIGGENSDLGDPVFAVADGRVLFAGEGGRGWGNVIIVLHAYEEGVERKYVQSYYGHVERILVQPNKDVHRGEQIATVGTAGGLYLAHLHFEMREFVTPFVGPGYRSDTRGWLNPSDFVRAHRGAAADDVGRRVAGD